MLGIVIADISDSIFISKSMLFQKKDILKHLPFCHCGGAVLLLLIKIGF